MPMPASRPAFMPRSCSTSAGDVVPVAAGHVAILRFAIMHQNAVARDQLLALADDPLHAPERPHGNHAPVGHEPRQVVMVARIGEDRKAGAMAAANRAA